MFRGLVGGRGGVSLPGLGMRISMAGLQLEDVTRDFGETKLGPEGTTLSALPTNCQIAN